MYIVKKIRFCPSISPYCFISVGMFGFSPLSGLMLFIQTVHDWSSSRVVNTTNHCADTEVLVEVLSRFVTMFLNEHAGIHSHTHTHTHIQSEMAMQAGGQSSQVSSHDPDLTAGVTRSTLLFCHRCAKQVACWAFLMFVFE